ncbi:MAG: 16S rRNA (guanine(527)-N(7))-methyltransferase RsmG [Sphingomonadaceae bacterium]|uniref:16S rRNA (guanine(527)-N(7))-methyltransferase RsmG n=1 Tax=Thermaurantiacus sp. TaxID=2820283 RepID=UPI00298F2487|nr:16S rRNA (guanine(527)-N(7))-methyltransferase RsmG [Thermaurantiacus sp.]MCS6987678.1 16S rRNA (guanine(527)-N(7))-methyltransferase RsmG [Sphingomonadaceae bacterium]MDW8415279.1 16S rRNA (guanine(527)-N(7))-methyltransferase RsmG [Thermaurantiacus sp.]
MTPDEFATLFAVPRGTLERLARYEALLRDHQRRMNLVASSTLADVWGRHFADSAQLAAVVPPGRHWLDVGSGAGFPGLVLALLGHGPVTLVESVAKKCRFLHAAAAELGLEAQVRVIHARIERLPPQGAQVITARATASLDRLLDWTLVHGGPGALWVLPKGRTWAREVAAARARFRFDLGLVVSRTDPEARILLLKDPARKAGPCAPSRSPTRKAESARRPPPSTSPPRSRPPADAFS